MVSPTLDKLLERIAQSLKADLQQTPPEEHVKVIANCLKNILRLHEQDIANDM